jgi:hypothetical protein
MAKISLLYGDQDPHLLFNTVGLPLGRDDLAFVNGDAEGGEAVREQTESTAQFARLVNRIPKVSRTWQPKDRLVWDEVQRALDPSQTRTANEELTVDEKERLNKALTLLYGENRSADSISDKHEAYQKYQSAYLRKKAEYDEAKVDAKFEESEEAREEAKVRVETLKQQVDAAMEKWKTQGYKSEIEHAIQVKTEIQGRSSRVRRKDAREDVDFETSPYQQRSVLSQVSFLTTHYLPNDLYKQDSEGWMSFSLSKTQIGALGQKARTDLEELEDERLFDERLEMNDDIEIEEITFEIARAEIVRPWFEPGILESRNWMWVSEQEPLSDGGDPPSGTMPMYVTSMVLARNIEVTFASDDSAQEAGKAARKQGALSIGPLLLGKGIDVSDLQAPRLTGFTLPQGGAKASWIGNMQNLAPSGGGSSSPATQPQDGSSPQSDQQELREDPGLMRTAAIRANVEPLRVATSTATSPEGGFQGVVREKNGSKSIDNASITFDQHQGSVKKSVTSTNGRYEVHLPEGKYVVTAEHPDYQTYSTEPGFFVLRGTEKQNGNIFMQPTAERETSTSATTDDATSNSEPDVERMASIQVLAFGCEKLDKAPNPDPRLDF